MTASESYYVIPLSVQREGDLFTVGNPQIGDFYQFPELGVRIVRMLEAGHPIDVIKATLAAKHAEMIDVDDFVGQLLAIGFIYAADQRHVFEDRLDRSEGAAKRVFSADPRFARIFFSLPALVCFLGVVGYAACAAFLHPGLRVNPNAFYIDRNRTALLLLVLAGSAVRLALHETGHMLAVARHGLKATYGVSNRLWNVVAETDLTGILTLPKAQRYLPMLAGLLVDVLCVALLTIVLQLALSRDANPFQVQVIQAVILESLIAMAWQFNIFVKTDIYFVVCNHFSAADLDADARAYIRDLVFRATLGRFGRRAQGGFRNPAVLRTFALIWLLGRLLSVYLLVAVFVPTILKYAASIADAMRQPSASVWNLCDMAIYIGIGTTMRGSGMYMWLKQKLPARGAARAAYAEKG